MAPHSICRLAYFPMRQTPWGAGTHSFLICPFIKSSRASCVMIRGRLKPGSCNHGIDFDTVRAVRLLREMPEKNTRCQRFVSLSPLLRTHGRSLDASSACPVPKPSRHMFSVMEDTRVKIDRRLSHGLRHLPAATGWSTDTMYVPSRADKVFLGSKVGQVGSEYAKIRHHFAVEFRAWMEIGGVAHAA